MNPKTPGTAVHGSPIYRQDGIGGELAVTTIGTNRFAYDAATLHAPAPDATATSAERMIQLDPPPPAGSDGWTPETVRVVRSNDPAGIVRSAGQFALGIVDEQPGQRLSQAQVDSIAPFLAYRFRVDEQFVRHELSKVYLYVGGPSTIDGNAMTVGSHVFMANEQDLRQILSPDSRRWLVHELSHTMQYLAYDRSNVYSFIDDYLRSTVIGRDPIEPGTGGGHHVWGAFFTGWRSSSSPGERLGAPSPGLGQRIGFSVVPAAVVSVPLALAAGGALALSRAMARTAGRGGELLGHGTSVGTALGVIALPAVAGSVAGALADHTGSFTSRAAGTIAGGAIAGAALSMGGAFHGSLGSRAAAFAAVGLASAIGYTTSAITANTVQGWSNAATVLQNFYDRTGQNDSYLSALHASHWREIDAEAAAQEYVTHPTTAWNDASGAGHVPDTGSSVGDRLGWGLWTPLLVGTPAAAIAGTAVHGARVAGAALGVSAGGANVASRIGSVMTAGSVMRSGAIGAAVTILPLVAGAAAASVTDSTHISQRTSIVAGTVSAATLTGVALTLLFRDRSSSLLRMTPGIALGMAVGAGAGLLSASAAVHAAHPPERRYLA